MRERLQALILDNMLEHVIFYEKSMKIVWANRAACSSVGLKPDDLIGEHCFGIWYGLKEPCPDCPVKKAFETGAPQEGSVDTPDGRAWLVQATPVTGNSGALEGVVEMALEITDLKKAEKKQARADMLHELINAMLDPVMVFNNQGVCVFANRAFEKMFDLKTKDYKGKNFVEMQGFRMQRPEEMAKYTPLFREAVMEGRSGPIELNIIRKNGTELHVSSTAGSVKDDRNRTTYLVVTLHDISRRKTVEEKLRESNRALRSSLHATVAVDAEGLIVHADSAFLLMWGYDYDKEVVGRHIEEIWQDRKLACEIMQTTVADGRWEGELTARKSDGVNFKARLTAVQPEDAGIQLWSVGSCDNDNI